ncbi:MAG: RluA family pseudouridine synthase, partial [Bdellovibrionota bacterium]
MNFLRLSDYLISPIFQDDDIIAIDKPYGFNTHTNESKVGNEDYVAHGLIEMFERQLGMPLFIVHRLDQTTTGVVIFAKSPEAAKKYAQYFFDKQVKKTYWFITGDKSQKSTFDIDEDIIHKGKDLPSQTGFNLIKRVPGFEFWEARPLTGRNHQIRIHAKAAGIPLLGDQKYDGKKFPFLCLHNRKIEFPNGISIEAKPPVYFEDLSILDDLHLAVALHESDRRQRLFKATADSDQTYRLVHKVNESNDSGYNLDQFGKVLVLSWFEKSWQERHSLGFSKLSQVLGKPILVKLMGNEKSNA